MKDAFYSELKAEKEKPDKASDVKKMTIKPRPVEDDPFASSEDEKPQSNNVSKGQKSVPKRKKNDETETETQKKDAMRHKTHKYSSHATGPSDGIQNYVYIALVVQYRIHEGKDKVNNA